ncbi:hypothetical protein ACNR90_002804 [Candidozyma auris]
MADYLHENLDVDVSIGLTSHAKFVDKSVSLLNYIRDLSIEQVKLTFLVGFDTLVRIFEPKYYLPDKLSDSLNEFMKTTDLFCLTRPDNVNSYQNQALCQNPDQPVPVIPQIRNYITENKLYQ